MEPTNPGDISLDAYRLAFRSSPLGLSFVDKNDRFVWANPALLRMLNYNLTQLRGLRIADVHPESAPGATPNNELFKENIESFEIEPRNITSDGREIWLNINVGLVRDKQGRPLYAIGQQLDITERKRNDEHMYWLAYHDGLTGLSTREVLDDRLTQALLRAQRAGYGQVALLYIDLDDFKHINDTYGHETGDRVLVEVAKRLSASVRESDTVCRFGGDEFVVLLDPIARADHARIVAERIHTALRHPLHGPGAIPMPARITASIGIATTHGAAVTANEFLRNADIALYQAKSRGGNTSEVTNDATTSLCAATILDLFSN